MRTKILDDFAQKLRNSGYRAQSSKIMIILGVSRYLHKLKLSRLPENDPEYTPLYLDKKYTEKERQCEKKMAKSNWFKSNKKIET